MLRYIYGQELHKFPKLSKSMFQSRAEQFSGRLGWDVDVDDDGCERDQYDAINPMYVIWEGKSGEHLGSYRLLPTFGQTLLNDHFAHLMDGAPFVSPHIWECTRFCLGAGAGRQVAAGLFLSGVPLLERFGLAGVVGVFDKPMLRVYAAIGAAPEIIATDGTTSVGTWAPDADTVDRIATKFDIDMDRIQSWCDASI